jgi:hypothetical protein
MIGPAASKTDLLDTDVPDHSVHALRRLGRLQVG